MWLILSEPHDDCATWLADGLRQRAPHQVVLLTSPDFGGEANSERGVARDGAWFRMRTPGGDVIDSRALRGVVNRAHALPPGLAQRMNLTDREQVIANFSAPILRALREMQCPVLNRPSAQGLSGEFRIEGEWSALADSAGFLSAPGASSVSVFRPPGRAAPLAEMNNTARLVVVGERVMPLDGSARAVPEALAAKCLKLAAAAHATLLGIDAVRLFPRDWRFFAADLSPDVRSCGAPLIDAVAEFLNRPVVQPPASLAADEAKRAKEGLREPPRPW